VPHQEGAFAQFARLTFPVAPGAQSALIPAGIDAVRISGSGELRPAGPGGHVNVLRYGSLGRAALRVVSALDAAERRPARGPDPYIMFAGKVLPSWPVELLALALTLPALIASIDALARARRRREPVTPWLVWLASALLPFAIGLALAELLVLVGLARDAPPAPLDPRSVGVDAAAVAVLAVTMLAIVVAWILARSSVIRRAATLPDSSAPGAACVTSLALCGLVLVLAFTNPYAALLLVPAVHLWMLATLTDARWRGGIVMFLVGLLPVAGVVLFYMWHFQLGPVKAAWYLFLLVTGDETGLPTTLACALLLAIAGSVAAILLARARRGDPVRERRTTGRPQEPGPPIFGPGGHAGPGAIGNARSTLGR
jgi:hypothetical protein